MYGYGQASAPPRIEIALIATCDRTVHEIYWSAIEFGAHSERDAKDHTLRLSRSAFKLAPYGAAASC